MAYSKRKYFQLTYPDRVLLSYWKARGLSLSEIALRIGVHKSTVSRELKRNGGLPLLDSPERSSRA